jgi:hypothetical protein
LGVRLVKPSRPPPNFFASLSSKERRELTKILGNDLELGLHSGRWRESVIPRLQGNPPAPPPDTSPNVARVIIALLSTDYEVIITNNTGFDADLTVTYFEYVAGMGLQGGTLPVAGPHTKALNPLPLGETVDFSLCKCLLLAPSSGVSGLAGSLVKVPPGYTVTCQAGGEDIIQTINVWDINKQEQQFFGQVDSCGDTLEVFIKKQ